jgi:hypothetical protein
VGCFERHIVTIGLGNGMAGMRNLNSRFGNLRILARRAAKLSRHPCEGQRLSPPLEVVDSLGNRQEGIRGL